ncbi:hypothetical protein ACP4OV_002683 [Aristida adscensionis]
MQGSGTERSLVPTDNMSPASPTDLEERAALEEKLYWARMQRQKFLALSAEADKTIWNLAALARNMMQERDEARSQAMALLADLEARNARMTMMTPGRPYSRAARPGAFAAAAAGNSQVVLAPPAFGLSGEPSATTTTTTTTMQGQRPGYYYCAASPSNLGHMSVASSQTQVVDAYSVQASASVHGVASSSQDYFDPDMFLVDVGDSPEGLAPAAAGAAPASNSGACDRLAEQRPLHWKGKSTLIHGAGRGQAP